MTTIEVAVRVRPFNSREVKYGSQCIIGMQEQNCQVLQVKNGKINEREAPKKYTFDHCFWTHSKDDEGENTNTNNNAFADQSFVYNELGKKILDNSLKGFNSCLFAYGQTGSGKTYSMMGISSDPGIIPRLCKDLFSRAAEMKDSNSVVVECSYLEIYNEQVRDLLNPASLDKPLRVRQHPKLGVYVENLTKLITKHEDEIEKLLDDGSRVRSVAATQMNATSSRSHAILTLFIKNRNKDGELASQLHLVDLAGSERATSTGAAGDTLVEGANINKSLTTLGMCLSRLAEAQDGKKGHIPFRDSQLTWLLNDSLGGNSRTAMLANISPASINFEETLSTMRFAMTVKKIKNHAKVNEDPQQKLIRELREEIDDIRKKIAAFEAAGGSSPATPAAAINDNDEKKEVPREEHVDPNAAVEDKEVAAATAGDNDDGEVLEGERDDETRTPTEGDLRAEPSKAELVALLMDNTRLFAEVGRTEEEREAEDEATKAERAKAMKALNESGVTVDPSLPRLVTLNENLHAYPSVALLYYLRQGENIIGAASTETPQPEQEENEEEENSVAAKNDDAAKPSIFLPSIKSTKSGALANTTIFAKHCAFHVDSLRRTVHIQVDVVSDKYNKKDNQSSAEALDDLVQEEDTPLVWVNGEAIVDSKPVQINHLDRVFIGAFAFRHSQPVTWYSSADDDEFSRDATTLRHLESLEHHERLEMQLEYQKLMVEFCNGEGVFKEHLTEETTAFFSDDLQECLFRLGESETTMCEQFPLTQADMTKAAATKGVLGLEFDYAYAIDEKGKRQREEQKRQREEELEKIKAQKAKEISELETTRKQQDADIEELEKELARQKEAKEKANEQRDALEATLTKETSDPGPKAPEPQRRHSITGGQAMVQLAKDLDAFENECREATQWKPSGPSRDEDREEYDFSTSSKNTLKAVRELRGEILMEAPAQKYRVKKGVFSRSGFHPVKILIRKRFLYYFDAKANDKSTALGAVYLFGCTVQALKEKLDGRSDVIRLIPCVPRKPSKSAMSPTDENNVVLAFDNNEKVRADVVQHITSLTMPVPPPKVAEYLKQEKLKAEADSSDEDDD